MCSGNTDHSSRSTPSTRCRVSTFRNRLILLLLVLSVPALSTLAKTSWFLPQTDTGHYLTVQVKMKAAQPPVLLDRAALENVALRVIAAVVTPEPEFKLAWRDGSDFFVPPIGLTVSLQHRSPPSFLS